MGRGSRRTTGTYEFCSFGRAILGVVAEIIRPVLDSGPRRHIIPPNHGTR